MISDLKYTTGKNLKKICFSTIDIFFTTGFGLMLFMGHMYAIMTPTTTTPQPLISNKDTE